MNVPAVGIPRPLVLFRSLSFWVWALYAVLFLAAVPDLFVQYWFNQSLGFRTLFWTNMKAQAGLFVVFGALVAAAVVVPVRWSAASAPLRQAAVHAGAWIGIFAGWRMSEQYEQFLLAFHGVAFGSGDPVFGRDIGFYVYQLPALRALVAIGEVTVLLGGISTLIARASECAGEPAAGPTLSERIRRYATPMLNFWLYALGSVAVAHTWLSRYSLLFGNNEASGVRLGAEYLDVVGVVSGLNFIYVKVLVEAGLTLAVGITLSRLWKGGGQRLRGPMYAGAALLALEFTFFAALVIKDHVLVSPNEPHIQREYIQRHIDATLRAYRLDRVQKKEWVPPRQPMPAADLLASKTIRNAPILPSWVSYLEEPPDIQHYPRINISGSTMVFGPMLQVFEQQQQLRPYYRFTSVDGVRYTVDGEKRMYASAVRELPSLAFLGPKEWLRYWGSAALLFTHGMGLVMSPVNEVDEVGNPTYAVKDVPPKAVHRALEHEPRIYFGEGAKDDYVLTNIGGLKEFDFATDQFRKEFEFPAGTPSGVAVNSVFRRVVFALHTKDLTAFLFSRYIEHDRTRVQIRREPILRARSLAPFLFLDTNAYAFVADKKVYWMMNALTTTSEYPYSFREVLGDKADERAVYKFPERVVNYAEDAVKVVMDAFTGEIRFYQMNDDPIVSTWAKIYPDLFTPASQMPAAVRAQLTYPLQWFHIQFDDIYKRYHQRDPIEFYNVEDLWDDADESLGSIGRGLSGFGTTDQMTFSYEGYHMLIDPADLPPGIGAGKPGEIQYVMMMPFTPEGGRNLRSVIVAFQDPEHYGELVSLQIPQGMFVPGPEQIDSYIDNDQAVHQQVTMWIRHGSEVVRGSTLLVPVKGDLLYIEPIWVSSTQNEMPQLKLFAVRYQGRITSGSSVAEAIRKQDALHDPPAKGPLTN